MNKKVLLFLVCLAGAGASLEAQRGRGRGRRPGRGRFVGRGRGRRWGRRGGRWGRGWGWGFGINVAPRRTVVVHDRARFEDNEGRMHWTIENNSSEPIIVENNMGRSVRIAPGGMGRLSHRDGFGFHVYDRHREYLMKGHSSNHVINIHEGWRGLTYN